MALSYSKSTNHQTGFAMGRRIWAVTVFFLSTTAAIVTIYAFFNIDQFEEIDFSYSCDAAAPQPVFRFVNQIYQNRGKTVLLNLQIASDCERSIGKKTFRRKQNQNSVRWSFEQCDLAEMWGIKCSYPLNAPQSVWDTYYDLMNARFGGDGVKFKQYLDVVPDNGLSIELLTNRNGTNALSWVQFQTEDYDVAHGPFQIRVGNNDGHNNILLSPAPHSDRLNAQVACAQSNFPEMLRGVVCPFY